MHNHSLDTWIVRTGFVVACATFGAGCGPWAGQWENWGNSRKEDEVTAAHSAPQAFVYQRVQPASQPAFGALPGQAIEIGGRQWVAMQGQERIPDRMLTAAGSADGVQIFRLSWDEPPYDQLYVQRGAGTYSTLR